jgi:ABC-type glycerol-3-phosphate transport system permease component
MQLVLVAVAFTMLFPIYFAVSTSLKTPTAYVGDRVGPPAAPTLENFRHLVGEAHLLDYVGNTVALIAVTLFFYVFVCCAAGFAFGMLEFKWKTPIFLLMLFLLIFPQMVLAMPLFLMMAKLHLINSRLGVCLVWLAYFSPFGAYIMSSYYSSVPKELLESARIDGAGILRTLLRIFVPVAAPMVATIAIVGFQAMWVELPFSLLLLQRRELRTLTLGIAMLQGEHGLPIPMLSAAIVVSAAIPIAIFFFFQKKVILGAQAGSLKG